MPEPIVSIGQFGKPFGVKGWIKVHSFTNPVHNLLDYLPSCLIRPLPTPHAQGEKKWAPLALENAKLHQEQIILKIKGIDTPEAVQSYTHWHLGIPQALLPPLKPGEYYWYQLIGLTVYTTHSQCLGVITGLFSTGANDVLEVEQEGTKKRLIPCVPQVLLRVDLEAQRVTVDWDAEF